MSDNLGEVRSPGNSGEIRTSNNLGEVRLGKFIMGRFLKS